jgi:YD repeat-containing protein
VPTIKKVLRVFTATAVIGFLILQIVVRRAREEPPKVRFKPESAIAKIALTHDSYPCLLMEGSPAGLQANLTTCQPALHNDSAVEQYEIDLRSGRFTLRQTDLFVPDSMPLALTRGYRLWDTLSRAFGTGGNHVYDIFPYGDRNPYTYMELLLGDGVTVHYDRISEGTGYADDVKQHRGATDTVFQNSRIAWNRDHWDLTFRDGTLYRFPEAYFAKRGADGALIGMRSPGGEEIEFVRDATHNLKRITSPHGHWIQFDYDSNNRVQMAVDDKGNSLAYSYDPSGRLVEVRRNGDLVWRYSYDATGMTGIERAGKEILIFNEYARGHLASLTIGRGRTYKFDYIFGPNKRVVETKITDPDGNQSALKF